MEVVLKTIPYHAALPVTTSDVELLPVELHNLLKLCHPNIQELLEYAYKRETKTWSLILEYSRHWEPLSNTSLATTRLLDEDDIRDIIQQLLSALVHCFDNGVDHRDISIDNIYLDRDTNGIKLTNFQHSSMLSILPHTLRKTPSSPTSTPPELYRTGSYTPQHAAVWSVGCLLFELVTGSKPLLTKDDAARNNVRWEELPPQSVSSDLYDLILMCLNPNPAHRLSFHKLLQHSWVVNETYV